MVPPNGARVKGNIHSPSENVYFLISLNNAVVTFYTKAKSYTVICTRDKLTRVPLGGGHFGPPCGFS